MRTNSYPPRVLGTLLALAVATGMATTACGGEPTEPAQPTQQSPTSATESPTTGQTGRDVSASGRLAPPESADKAFTYDPTQTPEGAELKVEAEPVDGSTKVKLEVKGLLPDRGYAAHAHTKPCGENGDAAGPHFQHKQDPAAGPDMPSTDPAYANPKNEIWLDLRTDGKGEGEAEATVPFAFTDRVPASVVIHAEEETKTGKGEAGKAGDRLACLTVPFG